MDRGNGEFQDGSFRELKILKEESREALEQQAKNVFNSLLLTLLHRRANDLSRALFCLVIRPRAATSTEKLKTRYSRDISAIIGAYLFSLYSWERSMFRSHGQVSSKRTTSRDCSFTKNISGRGGVTNT